MKGKDEKLDIQQSAEGLHHAGLRQKTRARVGFSRKIPNDPLIWASFCFVLF
jgi:hypothetical protein